MFKVNCKNRLVLFLVVASFMFLSGCATPKGYLIKYNLNKRDVVLPSSSSIPMKVQVVEFSDRRDFVEKDIAARKEKGFSDLKDYTYDWQFEGNVAGEITKMLIKHLNHSKVFKPAASLATFGSGQLSKETLNYLSKQGVDAVLNGEIENFYGYYDKKIGRQLLYEVPLSIGSAILSLGLSGTATGGELLILTTYPGAKLGEYLESLHQRQIEYHVKITTRLTSTITSEVLWKDSFDISFAGKKRMPGFSTGKRRFDVTVIALHEAANKMVESLANTKILIEK